MNQHIWKYLIKLSFAARCYAYARPMPSCGICLCVCLSRSWIMSKRINIYTKIFHHRLAIPFYIFHTKRGGDIPTGMPLTGKTQCWTNIWCRCIQVYSVVNRTSGEVWKTKPQQTAASVEHSPRRSSSVVRTRGRWSVCDGLNVICRRRREVKPPFVITPVVFCFRRTS